MVVFSVLSLQPAIKAAATTRKLIVVALFIITPVSIRM
jgi:hypothetical protein